MSTEETLVRGVCPPALPAAAAVADGEPWPPTPASRPPTPPRVTTSTAAEPASAGPALPLRSAPTSRSWTAAPSSTSAVSTTRRGPLYASMPSMYRGGSGSVAMARPGRTIRPVSDPTGSTTRRGGSSGGASTAAPGGGGGGGGGGGTSRSVVYNVGAPPPAAGAGATAASPPERSDECPVRVPAVVFGMAGDADDVPLPNAFAVPPLARRTPRDGLFVDTSDLSPSRSTTSSFGSSATGPRLSCRTMSSVRSMERASLYSLTSADSRAPPSLDGSAGASGLEEGQTARRCVHKGWLLKWPTSRWRKKWQPRFFRVVVHTVVQRRGHPSPRADLLAPPVLEEVVQSAWLNYYTTDTAGTPPKASIALEGARAQEIADPQFRAKAMNGFEVYHPRRRVFHLRPLQADDTLPRKQRSGFWMRAINTAVGTVGKPFLTKFKRTASQPGGGSPAPT